MTIQEFVPLALHTTFKIGGPARYFCVARSLTEIKEAIQFARKKHLPVFVLGGGSNVLISDAGFPGLVLRIAIQNTICWESCGNDVRATVGAGVVWDDFVRDAVARGYWGIENLSGIPGLVGASVIQNIGAYGVEVAEAVDCVAVHNMKTGRILQYGRSKCKFAYRDSIWKHDATRGDIIVSVRFCLKNKSKPNIAYKDLQEYFSAKREGVPCLKEVRKAVISIRKEKFPNPAKYGSAGSFFKNPIVSKTMAKAFFKKFPKAPYFNSENGRVKLSAAWIIDHALGLRGAKTRKGRAGTWKKQSLVLVNYGGASEKEVRMFAQKIQRVSLKKINVALEPEVVFV